jgi:membrane-associated phospholipid phosphatase
MTPPELLTDNLAVRRCLAALFAVSILAVVGLGVRYADTSRPGRLDTNIDAHVQRHLEGHIRILNVVVDVAPPLLVSACVLLIVGFLRYRRHRAAVLTLIGPGLATGLSTKVLKPLFGRRLHGGLSFPSGHTTGAVSVALVVVIFLLGPSRPALPLWPRVVLCMLAFCVAIGVAVALVGGDYHYATDTVGGLGVAITIMFGLSWIIDAVASRSRRS